MTVSIKISTFFDCLRPRWNKKRLVHETQHCPSSNWDRRIRISKQQKRYDKAERKFMSKL